MEDLRENRKKKTKTKNKKARKDKWGQPVLSEIAAVEAEEQEEEEEQQVAGPRGGRSKEQPGSYEPDKVVISGMPYSTTEDEIRDFFKDVGPAVQLQLSRFPDTGNFRGLAFVTFQTEAIATSSLKLDGTEMGNRFVKIERCRLDLQRKRKSEFLSEPEKADGCLSAYVGNLSWDVTEDDIRDCFKASGILSVRFAIDKKTGKSRGFCHIDFEDDESLENAMKKNQAELHGRPMKIAYAVCNRN